MRPSAAIGATEAYRRGHALGAANGASAEKSLAWLDILDGLSAGTPGRSLTALIHDDAELAQAFERDWILPLFDDVLAGMPIGRHFLVWHWDVTPAGSRPEMARRWHFDVQIPAGYLKLVIPLGKGAAIGFDLLDAETSQGLSARTEFTGVTASRPDDLSEDRDAG